MTAEEQTAYAKLVDSFCHQLTELGMDSVTIAATYVDHKGTGSIVRGQGNLYARRGALREWLTHEDERDRIEVRPNEQT